MTPELYNWDPLSQFINFRAARGKVLAGVAGARCKVIFLGDSNTSGVGGALSGASNYRPTGSIPAAFVAELKRLGYPINGDNFFGVAGDFASDSRLSFPASTSSSGVYGLGGGMITPQSTGQGVDFNPGTTNQYDRVDVWYLDNTAPPTTIAINGGSVIQTLTIANTNAMLHQTVNVTLGANTINLRITSAGVLFFEGMALWNSTAPSIEVYNGGSGGATSQSFTGTTGGTMLSGALSKGASLVVYMIGENDINNNSPSLASYVTYVSAAVAAFQAAGCDVLLAAPPPFSSTYYAAQMPLFRAALHGICDTYNVPLFDVSNRFQNSYATMYNNGLRYDTLHMNAASYRDLATRYANLLMSI